MVAVSSVGQANACRLGKQSQRLSGGRRECHRTEGSSISRGDMIHHNGVKIISAELRVSFGGQHPEEPLLLGTHERRTEASNVPPPKSNTNTVPAFLPSP